MSFLSFILLFIIGSLATAIATLLLSVFKIVRLIGVDRYLLIMSLLGVMISGCYLWWSRL